MFCLICNIYFEVKYLTELFVLWNDGCYTAYPVCNECHPLLIHITLFKKLHITLAWDTNNVFNKHHCRSTLRKELGLIEKGGSQRNLTKFMEVKH